MTCKGEVDLHTDSGYRRVNGDNDEVKGQGMRGMNIIRRGTRLDGKGDAVHLLDLQEPPPADTQQLRRRNDCCSQRLRRRLPSASHIT